MSTEEVAKVKHLGKYDHGKSHLHDEDVNTAHKISTKFTLAYRSAIIHRPVIDVANFISIVDEYVGNKGASVEIWSKCVSVLLFVELIIQRRLLHLLGILNIFFLDQKVDHVLLLHIQDVSRSLLFPFLECNVDRSILPLPLCLSSVAFEVLKSIVISITYYSFSCGCFLKFFDYLNYSLFPGFGQLTIIFWTCMIDVVELVEHEFFEFWVAHH